MPPSAPSRQTKRKRDASGGSGEEEHREPVRNNAPQQAGDSEYMTCTCGSTIKKKYYWRHFYSEKHMKYLIPVLIREAKEKDAQREKELRLQRAAAQAARAQAEATTRATTSTSSTSERDPFDAEEACSEYDEDEQASSEDEL